MFHRALVDTSQYCTHISSLHPQNKPPKRYFENPCSTDVQNQTTTMLRILPMVKTATEYKKIEPSSKWLHPFLHTVEALSSTVILWLISNAFTKNLFVVSLIRFLRQMAQWKVKNTGPGARHLAFSPFWTLKLCAARKVTCKLSMPHQFLVLSNFPFVGFWFGINKRYTSHCGQNITFLV